MSDDPDATSSSMTQCRGPLSLAASEPYAALTSSSVKASHSAAGQSLSTSVL